MRFMVFVALIHFALCTTTHAADDPLKFSDPIQQQRYAGLLEELRCLVCQNQSLADSNAELAQDLRNEVYRMVDSGQERAAILDFMVARYGDFVLYRPPLKTSTWLLWGAPALLFIAGLIVVLVVSRKRGSSEIVLDGEERARLTRLLDERRGKS